MKHGYPKFQFDGETIEPVMECAEFIKEYCKKSGCGNCIFYTRQGFCELREGYPHEWNLNELLE